MYVAATERSLLCYSLVSIGENACERCHACYMDVHMHMRMLHVHVCMCMCMHMHMHMRMLCTCTMLCVWLCALLPNV